MATVTVSPKCQVVIPKDIREKLGLATGQRLQIVLCGDRLELAPVRPARRMRGFLRDLDTRVPRDAVLWTQDAGFKGMRRVEHRSHRRG